jgi:hypothetical protein
MGFLRIVGEGLKVFGVLGLVFGPTILLPSLWGLVESGRAILQGDRSLPSWALILNTAAIGFLPYSTFREPLGLIRFATGMVLATIYYGIYTRSRKPLNIGMFWIALLAFLIA